MSRRYRKLPVEIEAVQLTWPTWSEVCEFLAPEFESGRAVGGVKRGSAYFWGDAAEREVSDATPLAIRITTLEGVMVADEGDWIIRGVKGEVYPCKPDIFEQTYEPVG
jgi:hypothetical protein